MRQAPVIRTKTQCRKNPTFQYDSGDLAKLSWICRYYWWTRICFHCPDRLSHRFQKDKKIQNKLDQPCDRLKGYLDSIYAPKRLARLQRQCAAVF